MRVANKEDFIYNMTAKNHQIKTLRISSETNSLLNEAAAKLDFKKPDLIRFLLNRSLQQLKSDSIRAGGYDQLQITLRQQKEHNA
jgi:hypothetical protein